MLIIIEQMARKVDIVVISDTHLGTYGCRAHELHQYLKSIKPGILILNGDIIDIWQFSKSYFPNDHLKVIKRIISLSSKDTKVIYVTGNHDEFLRRFTAFQFGNIELVNKKVLELGGKKAWIFHGDVFDASVQHSKWLAKFGSWGYDMLIRINIVTNWFLSKMGKEKYSFSKKIKESVKEAVKYIGDFEKTATELAIEKGFDYVICGHIHHPQIKKVTRNSGQCIYLNSGDWIENLTALEFNNEKWEIHTYNPKDYSQVINETEDTVVDLINTEDLIEDVTSELTNQLISHK